MKARHIFVQMLKTKDQGKILELLEEKAIAYRGTKAADLSIEVACIRRPRSDIVIQRPRSDIIKKKNHKESDQAKSCIQQSHFQTMKAEQRFPLPSQMKEHNSSSLALP